DTEEKVGNVKEEEPVKRVGKRKKQKARKGISINKSPQGDSETDKEESIEAMNPTPLDTKSNILANWKIFQQGWLCRNMEQIGLKMFMTEYYGVISGLCLIHLSMKVLQKVGKVKEEEPVKRVGKRKKQKARKGISINKSPQGDSETDKEESIEAMNPTPLDTKYNIVAN
ncbi:hypothetical protein Tco_0798261, partial [Tanacetum coccineum]